MFLPMLDGDGRSAVVAQAEELTDRRVVQVWDPDREVGELSARTLGLTSTAWDVYLVYPVGVTWDSESLPVPTYWMHQLPAEIGADQGQRLDPDALRRAVEGTLAPDAVAQA